MRKAVVLLSGGLDSATVLQMALASGRRCHVLTIEYGQRHGAEIEAARALASAAGVAGHHFVKVDLGAIGGSALTDPSIDVPTRSSAAEVEQSGIPVTYVPARNTILLSVALALAEAVGAAEIWCGVNAVDYSGYPDCRPAFIKAFQDLAEVATRAGVEGSPIVVKAPLMEMSKAEIVRTGTKLGVDYSVTTSCYSADERGGACGRCDACLLRRQGFEEAGLPDPTRYVTSA